MKLIKVTRGTCGIKYTDAKGNTTYNSKTAADGVFEIDEAQAERLVSLGVAEYATGETVAKAAENAEETDEGKKLTGHLDADQLGAMDYNELKKLAAEMGVTPKGKKKDDYIEAICAAEVEAGEEDEDELPDLNAADPE